jgi:hypothetical protein
LLLQNRFEGQGNGTKAIEVIAKKNGPQDFILRDLFQLPL